MKWLVKVVTFYFVFFPSKWKMSAVKLDNASFLHRVAVLFFFSLFLFPNFREPFPLGSARNVPLACETTFVECNKNRNERRIRPIPTLRTGFTEFYWVFLFFFTGLRRFCTCFGWFYRVLLGFTEFYLDLQGFT